MTPIQQVAVVGLGVMGFAFADRLARAGYSVTGYDPDATCRARAEGSGVWIAESAATAISRAQLILCSLPSPEALFSTAAAAIEAVEGTPFSDRPTIVELSTLDLHCKQKAHNILSPQGIHMLDCPVSGTGAQASAGEVVVYASGDSEFFERTRPVIETFSHKALFLGQFGNGTRVKLIANLLVAIHNVAAAEALTMAERAGIDAQRFCDIIGAGGAAGSRILELRGSMMAKHTYLPATMRLDLWRKDLELIEKYAAELDAATPLFDRTLSLYGEALHRGLGAADTAAVCEVLRSMSNAANEPN